MLHIALADCDQLRQFVVALDQQHVDIGPGKLDSVAYADQAVVNRDGIAKDCYDDKGTNNQRCHGAFSLRNRAQSLRVSSRGSVAAPAATAQSAARKLCSS